MKKLVSLLSVVLLTLPAFAGSEGTAIIKGKSGSGRTEIELHTIDIGNAVKYVKFTIDGKSYEFDLTKEKVKDTYGYVIYDSKHQVFTVFVDNKQINFKFWMIPGTRVVDKESDNKWKFSAYVEATDPRGFDDKTRNFPMAPVVQLNCTLDYSL